MANHKAAKKIKAKALKGVRRFLTYNFCIFQTKKINYFCNINQLRYKL